MEKKEIFGNIDIKSLITIVALVVWLGVTVYGCVIGQFDPVFSFFKECFLMVISFYLGSKINKKEDAEQATITLAAEAEPIAEPGEDFYASRS